MKSVAKVKCVVMLTNGAKLFIIYILSRVAYRIFAGEGRLMG